MNIANMHVSMFYMGETFDYYMAEKRRFLVVHIWALNDRRGKQSTSKGSLTEVL